MRDTFDWTEARIARLTRLWRDGRNGTEIADALGGGLTRSAVCGKLYRLGLMRPERAAASLVRVVKPVMPRLPSPARTLVAELPAGAPCIVALPPPTASGAHLPRFAGEERRDQPWMERRPYECCWPVGGEGEATRSCCAPARPLRVGAGAYCETHRGLMFGPKATPVKDMVRLGRLYA